MLSESRDLRWYCLIIRRELIDHVSAERRRSIQAKTGNAWLVADSLDGIDSSETLHFYFKVLEDFDGLILRGRNVRSDDSGVYQPMKIGWNSTSIVLDVVDELKRRNPEDGPVPRKSKMDYGVYLVGYIDLNHGNGDVMDKFLDDGKYIAPKVVSLAT